MTPQQAGILKHYASLSIMPPDVSSVLRSAAESLDTALLHTLPENPFPDTDDLQEKIGVFIGYNLSESVRMPGFMLGCQESVDCYVFEGLWREVWNAIRTGSLQDLQEMEIAKGGYNLGDNTYIRLLDNGFATIMRPLTPLGEPQ